MSRSAALAALTAIALVAVGLGPVAASPQPTPICSICGQTFHENVTATEAILQVRENGDVHWRVENELSEPTASEWREDPGAAERQYRDAVTYGFRAPASPGEPTIEMRGDTLVIEVVDRGAARQRLGLLVVPYFHGEGSTHRWVVNADELVVRAPSGHRILNDPAGASVEEDRAAWTGYIGGSSRRDVSSAAPEPGDTYVVIGDGVTVDARAVIVTGLMPLDPALYGMYALGLLLVAGVSFGTYTIEGSRLGPRRVLAGVATVSLPYLLLVLAAHPPNLGGLGGFFLFVVGLLGTILLGLIGGASLYLRAAAAEEASREGTG